MLIINVIFSWLIAMSIFNTQNRIIIAIYFGTKRLTDPLLNPIRNFLPNLGGIDISPVVLILILYFTFQNAGGAVICTICTGCVP